MNETTDKMLVTIDDLVVEFASSMAIGTKAIQAAAETYVTALRKFPTRAEAVFAERFPNIRKETWALLHDIGRGALPPQTMMMLPGAIAKLRDARIPKKVVASVAQSKVRVYEPTTGKYKDVPFTHLTEGQADLVFNPVSHNIRTVQQQVRYIRQGGAMKREIPRTSAPCYAVVEDGIVFRRGGKMTFEEMAEIVRLNTEENAE